MRRFQIKANPSKDWNDAGPDLLRTRKNARAKLRDDLDQYGAGWFVGLKYPNNDQWQKYEGPVERAELLEAFDNWQPPDKSFARWARKQSDGSGFTDPLGVMRAAVINVKAHNGCTDHTDQVIALLERAWPEGAFGGAFVCKQVSGSSSWSSHAYGRAYDHSPYELNDRVTDWCLRMARENKADDIVLPVWQILGSKNGNVGNGNNGDGDWIGNFDWAAGGCDSSHEWHVHIDTGKSRPSGTPSCASTFAVPEHGSHHATDDEDE